MGQRLSRAHYDVLLVGSVPLDDAEAVFRSAAGMIGRRMQRIPDGETGERLRWIEWQIGVFDRHPDFEQTDEGVKADWRNNGVASSWKIRGWHRLRPGVRADALEFGPLGYAKEALASYVTVARLKKEGIVHAGCRFQVAIPTPYNVIDQRILPEHRLQVEAPYERRLLREVGEIAAAIPHGELAIQWDAAHEVQNLDGGRPHWFDNPEAQIVERLARLGNAIPAGVELGYHFCYGSFGHKHFVDPRDMGLMVRLANAVSRKVSRAIAWHHMPVPRDRSDDAYFAPLKGLELSGAKLFLGLIHLTDGAAGAQRRIDAARRFLPEFGVSTECGFGRRHPETTQALLELHATVSDLHP